MISHHPDDNILTEYASGSLAVALGLIVCAHLQTCPHCRKRVEGLNKLGATILSHSVAEAVNPESFTQVMARIHTQSGGELATSHKAARESTARDLHATYAADPLMQRIPKVIAKLLPRDGKLKWARVSKGLKTARLTTGQREYEVAFQRITSGNTVVEHDHGGLEVTLVLCGSFSDADGVYSEGDFLVRTPGEIHRPTATQNQDCLCISVTQAPVKMTGFLGKLINPFLGFRPA